MGKRKKKKLGREKKKNVRMYIYLYRYAKQEMRRGNEAMKGRHLIDHRRKEGGLL